MGGWGSQGPRFSHLLVHFSYGGVSVLQDFAKLFSHVSTLGGGLGVGVLQAFVT